MPDDCLFGDKYVPNKIEQLSSFVSFPKLHVTELIGVRVIVQFALHKNTEKVNMLWKQLDFFSPDSFAARLGSAARMLKELKSPDEVFYRNFNSAEGWYSEVVFKSGVSVKILGRGLDDFNQDPVMLLGGVMMRCKVEWLHLCVQELKHKAYNVSTLKLPALEVIDLFTCCCSPSPSYSPSPLFGLFFSFIMYYCMLIGRGYCDGYMTVYSFYGWVSLLGTSFALLIANEPWHSLAISVDISSSSSTCTGSQCRDVLPSHAVYDAMAAQGAALLVSPLQGITLSLSTCLMSDD